MRDHTTKIQYSIILVCKLSENVSVKRYFLMFFVADQMQAEGTESVHEFRSQGFVRRVQSSDRQR